MRHFIPLCAVLVTLLGGTALAGAESGSTSPAVKAALESAELARSIAASIIHERSLDYASAGRLILAQQLESLSKGLLESKITLADAALVMQIVSTPASQSASASGLTPLAKTSVSRAENLLDGAGASDATPTASPANAETKSAAAETTPSADAMAPAATTVGVPKILISEVCGVQNGDDHHVMVAALSSNSKDGLVKGEHVVFKLKGKLIAQGTILRLDDHLSFVEITKGTLVDPAQDVTQQCQAIITPTP